MSKPDTIGGFEADRMVTIEFETPLEVDSQYPFQVDALSWDAARPCDIWGRATAATRKDVVDPDGENYLTDDGWAWLGAGRIEFLVPGTNTAVLVGNGYTEPGVE